MMPSPLSAGREKRPIKSLVTGRPILLALEDIDGSPFLEKALRFLEKHGGGQKLSLPEAFTCCYFSFLDMNFDCFCKSSLAGIKVEGILRQAADVEEVDRRLLEYEQGWHQFLLNCIIKQCSYGVSE